MLTTASVAAALHRASAIDAHVRGAFDFDDITAARLKDWPASRPRLASPIAWQAARIYRGGGNPGFRYWNTVVSRNPQRGRKPVELLRPGLHFIPNKIFPARGRCVAAPFDSASSAPRPKAGDATATETNWTQGRSGRHRLGAAVPHETIFLAARNGPETIRRLHCRQQKGGVMDFVVSFLALISIGVFAAHTLDALRAG